MAYRTPYQSGLASRPGALDRNGEGDRFRERRRQFDNWYSNIYPTWSGYAWPGYGYGYPYTLNPGFFDWGDSDDSAYDQGGAAPDSQAPYPDQDYGAPQGYPEQPPAWPGPGQQSAMAGLTAPSAPASGEPLTVIFKSDRAPVKIQNYMMTADVLTDLDSRHYEQIPLDQIDVARTRQANRANGVDFQVPGALRN